MNSWKISAFAFVVVCLAFSQARTIKLVTEDGESIEVDTKVASVSGTIGGLLEVFEVESNDDDISVPLPNVNGKILRLVLEWAEKHKDDPISTDTKRNNDIPAWDAEFLAKLEQDTLFEVILAANYLDVNGLLDVSTKTVANMIKGKSPEEIRKTFNIKNDFTPEEEEQMNKENNWQE